VRFKQKVTDQPPEFLRPLPLPLPATDDLRHFELRVAVTDPLPNAAEEPKGPYMALQEDFGTLARKDVAVNRIAVRQRQEENHHLFAVASDVDIVISKVDLGFAGIMLEWQKDFFPAQLEVSDGVLDDRVSAIVAVLGFQPFVDPPGGVPLLAMLGLVRVQNRSDDWSKLIQLGSPRRPRQSFLRRHWL
jgi:hypothetical protein